MRIGRVPEKLFIVMKPETDYEVRVDGREIRVPVKPAFAVDGDSDNMIAKAKEWGTHHYYSKVYDEKELTFLEVPNESFNNLRLINIEKRSEGGCAYKVVDMEGRLYDLREDVFLESLYALEIDGWVGAKQSAALPRGVYLTGEFVWAVNGSQMRMVRVGSNLHKELQEAGERRKLVALKRKDLVPGTIYRMRGGDERAYLGYRKGKGMLITEISWDKKLSWQKRVDAILKRPIDWDTRYVKSHTFVEAVGTFKVPKNIYERVDAVGRVD